MNVLVTGGLGFIGSHLVEELLKRDTRVTIIDDGSSAVVTPSRLSPAQTVDLRVQNGLGFLKDINTIYHLAAVSRVGPAEAEPQYTQCVNVAGTYNVLELARATGARVVFASSCLADYPESGVYAFTKRLGEMMCRFYAKHYNVPTAVFRLFNVYGPREHESGSHATVVGAFARAKRHKEPLIVHGDGRQTRDFVHVSDVVTAMLGAEYYNEPIEVGTDVPRSINTLVKLFGGAAAYAPAPPKMVKHLESTVSTCPDRLPEYIKTTLRLMPS